MKRWYEGLKIRWRALRSRPVVVAAAVYAAVSLVCTQIPLLNYLGFEFSFVIALVGSFVSAFLTIKLNRPSDDHRSFVPSFLSSVLINLLLLVIPLIIILLNALFVRNCSILEGLGFFALLPVVSVWFSACLGLFALVHYRRSRTIVVLIILGSIGYAAALGYFTPAIFSYNFFYGFFPGLSYDELLIISWPLVLFRLVTLALGGVLLWLTMILVECSSPGDSFWRKGMALLHALVHPSRFPIAVLIVCSIGLVLLFRCDLGFESTAGYIQKTLGGKLETRHFTIYYAPEAYTGDELQYVASDHEFRFKQILTALGRTSSERLTSYIYPSAALKQRLIGTGTTNIAKPWNREIHLTKQSLDATLKHEMIHVLTGEFGMPIINASTSTGLVEGVAMALENRPGNRTLHEYAAAMRRFGVFPDIRRLMTPSGFLSQSSSVSYILAGSLCRSLIERHGIAPLLEVYRSGNYERAYGAPLDTLVNHWNRMLDSIPVPEENRGVVDVFFRARPIFGKICPRVLARRVRVADRLFGDRDYPSAYAAYEDVYRNGRSMEAFRGMMACYYRMWKFQAVTTAVDSLIRSDEHPLRYLTLYLLEGDSFWAQDDTTRARERYAALAHAGITEGFTEAALVRQRMLASRGNRDRFLSYVYADRNDSARIIMLDSLLSVGGDTALCRYLQGRVLYRLGRWETAIRALAQGTPVPEDRFLEYLRQRTMGECFVRLGRLSEALTAFQAAQLCVSAPQQEFDLQEWIDRCRWMGGNDLH